MPKYRFTATDRAGLYKSGIIDADTPREARDKLRERGFHVQELVDVSTPSGDPEPLDIDDTPPPRARRAPVADDRPRGAAGGRATFVLALLAFLLTLATASYVVYRDPPWGRLSRYDFSTPEASQRSQLKMASNGDLLAMIELNRKLDRQKARERLESLSVRKAVDYQGKKGLFTSVKVDGKTRHTVEWFEKDADTGYWKQAFVNEAELGKTDGALADEIRKWRSESDHDESKW
jgi:hypothetical protein